MKRLFTIALSVLALMACTSHEAPADPQLSQVTQEREAPIAAPSSSEAQRRAETLKRARESDLKPGAPVQDSPGAMEYEGKRLGEPSHFAEERRKVHAMAMECIKANNQSSYCQDIIAKDMRAAEMPLRQR